MIQTIIGSIIEMKLHKKRKFSSDEDRKLLILVEKIGTMNWEEIARSFPDRTRRQLRERYKFYLDPTINKNP
jgi:hypothetical protein